MFELNFNLGWGINLVKGVGVEGMKGIGMVYLEYCKFSVINV